MIKIYEYSKCSTCIKALKYLDHENINYQKMPIVDNPPTISELKNMLFYLKSEGHSFKKLFNTSGLLYKELQISQKINDGLTESEALKLLSQNGKLIKRPFLISNNFGLVGFKIEDWKRQLKNHK